MTAGIMTRVALVVAALVAMTDVAAADPHKVLVLQADGRSDAKVRAKIDQAIVKLAKTGPDTITAGEITYTDAAAMVGCKPDEASCKDEVIGTLGVDEIVIVTVTPKPGGLEVVVRRASKGAAPREVTTMVATDQLDKLDAIAPLFTGKPTTPPTPPLGPTGPTPPPIGPSPPAVTNPPTGTEPPVTGPPTTATHPETLPPIKEEPPKSVVVERHDDQQPRRRLQIAGMAGGGAMVLVGLVYWAKTNSIQGDIDKAPNRTKADLQNLKNLESEGDHDATARTAFVVAGLALGGVSTYFYIKGRRAKHGASTARLLPTLLDHGAGVALTIGGSP
jgi:hypothetical protein